MGICLPGTLWLWFTWFPCFQPGEMGITGELVPLHCYKPHSPQLRKKMIGIETPYLSQTLDGITLRCRCCTGSWGFLVGLIFRWPWRSLGWQYWPNCVDFPVLFLHSLLVFPWFYYKINFLHSNIYVCCLKEPPWSYFVPKMILRIWQLRMQFWNWSPVSSVTKMSLLFVIVEYMITFSIL